MSADVARRARFRATTEATADDWQIIDAAEERWRRDQGAGAGLLRLLSSLKDHDSLGAPVNLYTHCLQTATRALRAGADDELVAVALFHDLPEAISENDHGSVAAQLLAPHISKARTWLLVHHGAFQGAYFANHPSRGPRDREKLWDHPFAQQTDEFCRLYDQNSFDPDYPSFALDAFQPIVQRFFSTRRANAQLG